MDNIETGVRNWGDAFANSFREAMAGLAAAIPNLLGFLLIVLIGWIVASLLSSAVGALLRAVRFNELANRAGLSTFVNNMGLRTDPAGFVALITRWLVWLVTFVVAFDALGLPAVSNILQQMLAWLPNLIVALVLLVIGGLVAGVVANLVRGATATARLGDPNLLASIAQIAVWAFAIVAAINQLGIAPTLVNTLLIATVGSVALALGLAFGLGGRDTAGQMVQRWYQRSQEMAPQVKEAAREMRNQGTQGSQRPSQP